jgi:hypothetical protein
MQRITANIMPILFPHDCVGLWIKEMAGADVAHFILRYDRENLIAACGRVFAIDQAIKMQLGVRCCNDCVSRSDRKNGKPGKGKQNGSIKKNGIGRTNRK